MKKLPLKAILPAIFCNILFGSAGPFIKLGYAEFNIADDLFLRILFAGVRFFVSGLIVLLVDALRQKAFPKVHRENRWTILWVAVTYTFLQYACSYMGLANVTGSVGSVIPSTTTFISIFVAHFIYRDDRLNLFKILGCVIGFAGILIACYSGESLGGFSFNGEGLMLASAFFFVIGSVFLKKAGRFNTGFTLTAYNLTIGGGLLIVVGLIGRSGTVEVTLGGILVLCYLVFVSSVGFTLWSMLLKKYPISLLSVFNFIIPISGTILSGIFLRENIFTWQNICSLILVTAGILIVNKLAVGRGASDGTKPA